MPNVQRLLTSFLLSPWGLILPLTGIALLLLAMQLEKLPPQLAETYAQRLIDCPESEIDELVDAIVRLGDSGLPALVGGLRSERESVFRACRNALQRNFELWATQKESHRNEHYRRLTESLLQEVDGFKQTALMTASEFVDRILRETSRYQSRDAKKSVVVAANCERLLDRLRVTRQRMESPNEASSAPTGDTIVRLHRSAVDPTLLAAEEPMDERLMNLPHVDEFALPRAELLHAYHNSSMYRQQTEMPYRRPGNDFLPPSLETERPMEWHGEMIASMGPGHPIHSFAVAETRTKVADQFVPESTMEFDIGNIVENYITDGARSRPLDRNGKPFRTESTPINESDDFLTEELNRMPLEKIPSLPTTKLMRLLQHADDRTVSTARRTLGGRDGFQDLHLRLAFQLYHPLPTVRAELIGLLPNIGGIQQSAWLAELMNDPNADVRFLAASALATSSDPSMQRLLVDKGKRDVDPRIVELAERIQEQRRRIRR